MSISPSHRFKQATRPTSMFAVEAQQLLSRKQATEAIELCKRGLIYYPEHVTGYVILSQAYLDLGKHERAMNVLRDGFRRTGSERLEQLQSTLLNEPAHEETAASFESRTANGDPQTRSALQRASSTQLDPLDRSNRFERRAPSEEKPSGASLWQRMEEIEEDLNAQGSAELIDEIEESEAARPRESAWVRTEEQEAEDGEQRTEDGGEAQADALAAEPTEAEGVDVAEETGETAVEAEEIVVEAGATDVEAGEVQKASDQPIEAQPIQTTTSSAEPETLVAETQEHEAHEHETEGVDVPESATSEGELIDAEAPEAEAHEIEAIDIELTGADGLDVEAPETQPPSRLSNHESAMFAELTRSEPAPMLDPQARRAETSAEKQMMSSLATLSDRPRHLSLALHAGKNISRLRSSNLRLIPGLEFAPLRSGDRPEHRQPIAPLINEPQSHLKFPERTSTRTSSSIDAPGSLPPLEESLPPDLTLSFRAEREEPETAPIIDLHSTPTRTHEHRDAAARPRTREAGRDRSASNVSIPMTPGIEQRPRLEGEELTPLEELARRLEHARIPVVEEEEPETTFEPSIVSETFANILVAQGRYAEALKAFQTLARVKPEQFEYLQRRITEMKWRLRNPGKTWPPEEEF